MTIIDRGSSYRSRTSILKMGDWLRNARLQRRHTQKDVADAIGRGIQYVCDVEKGRRGHKMDPVIALLWCEYLALDPETLFGYLGLGQTDTERYRIQHYLETTAWAHRLMGAKRQLERALPESEDLWASLKPGSPQKAQALQVRDAIRGSLNALRIPRSRKGGET